MESSTADRAAHDAPVEPPAPTFVAAFHRTAREHPGQVAFRTRDGATALTWGELRARVDALAGGLHRLGLRRGENVALMFGNRPEFNLADLAVVTVGATPFSIYFTSSPEEIAFVVGDAQARFAIVDGAFAGALQDARDRLPTLEHVIVVDGDGREGTLRLEDVEADPDPAFDADAAAAETTADDLLTLIYTSGTTGNPKGVELTHGALMAAVGGLRRVIALEPGFRVISWLPNAHIAERAAHHYLPVAFAGEVTCADDPRKIGEVLAEVHPTWFFAVPRIFEKIKAGLEARLAAAPPEAREQADRALGAALQKVRLEQAGEPVPGELAAAVAQADAAMFSGLRAALGLDALKTINVGAAPTPVEVLEFFHAIGVPIAELWGMSETCGYGTVNPVGRIKIGTVGPPSPGAQVRLAEDGELLVRGAFVMRGYRNLPDRTAEALDDEGWLHTGDIATIDEDGYVAIVDRKKELIINAAGKNMSPANIEAQLKSAGPLIGQAAVIGDRRPYNTALVVLDADGAPAFAATQGVEGASLDELAADERIRAAVAAEVERANAKLARVEQVKRFHIVPGDWLPGGDELTPTMKLKRKPIAAKYASEIDGLYSGS
jgi:long-subunit acyl-CoA synthetase (AMP-forming)